MVLSVNISLDKLPLRPSSLQIWNKRGFTTTKEVEQSKQSGLPNLAAELETDLAVAAQLVQEVEECCSVNSSPQITTAASLVQKKKRHNQHIVTFCREIDSMLGGGIALGELTELAGPPGVGKTQWSMQLAVNASLPIICGGVEGQAIYIDTEGSLAPERCRAMAQALVRHVETGVKKRKRPTAPWFTVDNILQGITVHRVHDQASQSALLHSLPRLVDEMNRSGPRPVRLILIDSMAFHHRALPLNTTTATTNNDYFVGRTRMLTSQASLLSDLAQRQGLAVVALNQMTTKTDESVPALGESWAHAVTTRLLLGYSGTCTLTKSPRLPSESAQYQIQEVGIRSSHAQK